MVRFWAEGWYVGHETVQCWRSSSLGRNIRMLRRSSLFMKPQDLINLSSAHNPHSFLQMWILLVTSQKNSKIFNFIHFWTEYYRSSRSFNATSPTWDIKLTAPKEKRRFRQTAMHKTGLIKFKFTRGLKKGKISSTIFFMCFRIMVCAVNYSAKAHAIMPLGEKRWSLQFEGSFTSLGSNTWTRCI